MANTCTVCRHPEREAIDRAIISSEPERTIANRYGVTKAALHRHKVGHLPPLLAKAHDAAEVFSADALTNQITGLLSRGFTILDRAETGDSITDMCAAMREVRGVLTLIAKVTGEIQTAPTVNVIQSPEWIEVQTVILHALAPYPDARIAVADALEVCEP